MFVVTLQRSLTRPEDVLALANERVTRDFTPEERRRYASLLDDASKDR